MNLTNKSKRDSSDIRAPWQSQEKKPAPVGQIKQARVETCAKCGWKMTADFPQDYFWRYKLDAYKPSDSRWLCCFCWFNWRLLLHPILTLEMLFERTGQKIKKTVK